MLEMQDRINLECRLSKAEENLLILHADIKEIKRQLHWIAGLIFSLNTTIIGLLTKGFGVL